MLALAPAPARVQVGADEFHLTLSRQSVAAGPVVVELVNRGEDEHDLAIRRLAPQAVTRRIRALPPGGVARLEARLPYGRYRLWCTLADHRGRGMTATLTITKRSL